ncbi:MAG: cytochrome c3 family protein [Thermoanaerobaculaceae bacterium]
MASAPKALQVAIALIGFAAVAVAEEEHCLSCHGSPAGLIAGANSLGYRLPQGALTNLVVKLGEGSVHAGLSCEDCHPEARQIPHPKSMGQGNPCLACHEEAAATLQKSVHRDPQAQGSFRAQCWACHTAHDVRPPQDPASSLAPQNVAKTCLQCHDRQEYLVGVHGRGVELAGLDMSATCVSCHGGHNILPADNPESTVARANVPGTCGRCHRRVTETYLASVHGRKLAEHKEDVPVCVDCHAAHATVDPQLPSFRNSSPTLCARCHADKKLAAKYGLRAEVFDTYVADFHGTTAELFRAVTPDQPLNKAVCYDCHGYHDVESVREVGATVVQQRLLERCRVCHKQATERFLSAWMGHYAPDRERYPVIYYVRLFYQMVIPSTIGFFLLYICLDIWGRWRRRRQYHA